MELNKPNQFNFKPKEPEIGGPTLDNLQHIIAQDRMWLDDMIERTMREHQNYEYSGVYSIQDYREHEEFIRRDQVHRIIDSMPVSVLEHIFNIHLDGYTVAPEAVRLTTRITL